MATGSMSKGPGKSYREGLSLDRLFRMFPTDEAWFTAERWLDGPYCPHCGSRNIQCGIAHPTMTHRCRDCPKRRMFSLKDPVARSDAGLARSLRLRHRTWLRRISNLVATEPLGDAQATPIRGHSTRWGSPKHMDRAAAHVTEFAGRRRARLLERGNPSRPTGRQLSARPDGEYRTGHDRAADQLCRPDRVVAARGGENPDGDDRSSHG